MHEYIVPFIRRQSRAYLLASITGMQGKLPVRDTWTVFLQSSVEFWSVDPGLQ